MISVCDLCDAHAGEIQVLAPVFKSYGGRQAFFGPAETIRTHEDNSRVREAVSEPGEGRVLVVDGGGSLKRSLLGGDLAGKAAKNDWSGVIVNGAVRDVAELEAEDLGVAALALIPMKTEKRGLGERGVTVAIAGALVNPGDWIYVDRDGAIVAREPLHDT
ncbi:MAG: ribonuclease E activity regulator RraA [Oceanicaulis sp.]